MSPESNWDADKPWIRESMKEQKEMIVQLHDKIDLIDKNFTILETRLQVEAAREARYWALGISLLGVALNLFIKFFWK